MGSVLGPICKAPAENDFGHIKCLGNVSEEQFSLNIIYCDTLRSGASPQNLYLRIFEKWTLGKRLGAVVQLLNTGYVSTAVIYCTVLSLRLVGPSHASHDKPGISKGTDHCMTSQLTADEVAISNHIASSGVRSTTRLCDDANNFCRTRD